MREFKNKLDMILEKIEEESGLISTYSVYNNRNEALSIFDEVQLDEEEGSLLLSILAKVPSSEKIAFVTVDGGLTPEYFAFPESGINDMYDSVEWEEKEDWEIALEREDFGISEIATIKLAGLDSKHGFILEILHDSHDILDFVEGIKNDEDVKKNVSFEISRGLLPLLSFNTLGKPIVAYIPLDNSTAFIGDENFNSLKSYILDSIFHEESPKGVTEYADGWGYDYDIEDYEDEDEDDYIDEDDNDCGVVAPFWLI